MYNTHIFTRYSLTGTKLIFKGMLPFIPHKGMELEIAGLGLETVGTVSYDIRQNSVEVIITSSDPDNIYPEIPLTDSTKSVKVLKCTFMDYSKELNDCILFGMRLNIAFNQKGFIMNLHNETDDVLAALSSESEEGFQLNYTRKLKYTADYWDDVVCVVDDLNNVWDGIWHEFISKES